MDTLNSLTTKTKWAWGEYPEKLEKVESDPEGYMNLYNRAVEKERDFYLRVLKSIGTKKVIDTLIFMNYLYDRKKNYLCLRYFVPIVDDPHFHGYQILFVFSKSFRPIRVYVNLLPLE